MYAAGYEREDILDAILSSTPSANQNDAAQIRYARTEIEPIFDKPKTQAYKEVVDAWRQQANIADHIKRADTLERFYQEAVAERGYSVRSNEASSSPEYSDMAQDTEPDFYD